jgi:hypothetical protein
MSAKHRFQWTLRMNPADDRRVLFREALQDGVAEERLHSISRKCGKRRQGLKGHYENSIDDTR